MVVLGSGEQSTKRCFCASNKLFPRQFGLKIGYDNAMAHKIEAGSDMFLMPSRYEPCGLNQIYSLKYGTVPVVRATGGLDDTIEPCDSRTAQGHGIQVCRLQWQNRSCWSSSMRSRLPRTGSWQNLMRNGMKQGIFMDGVGSRIRQSI